MAKIIAVTGCPTGIAHTKMAAEALKKTATVMGHDIVVEMQGAEGVQNQLTEEEIYSADVVIVSSDIYIDMARFAGKPMYAASTTEAIRYTEAVIKAALEDVKEVPVTPVAEHAPPKATIAGETLRIVGVTSCPTGIAHTFMAAEGVKIGAETLGHQVKVETQGSVGSQNTLTDEEIQQADLVIIAADTNVNMDRFQGKRVYETSTKAAIHSGVEVVENSRETTAPSIRARTNPAFCASSRIFWCSPFLPWTTGARIIIRESTG